MNNQRISPYDWKLPVENPELFAGRKDELVFIEEKISSLSNPKTPIPPMIAIIGERRVGKTSLSLRLEEICNTHKVLPIYITLNDGIVNDAWEFWHEFFSRLIVKVYDLNICIKDAHDAGFGFLRTRPPDKDKIVILSDELWFSKSYVLHLQGGPADIPPSYCIDQELAVIVKALNKSGCCGILFIIDEIEELLNETKNIAKQLRATMQKCNKCGIAFIGEPEADIMFSDPNKPFYHQVDVCILKNFTNQDDIIECALSPLSKTERCLVSPVTIDHLSRLSLGKPNLIRLICDATYSRYGKGLQDDLNINMEVLNDLVDKITESEKYKTQIDSITNLSSVDLEILHNITRYPKWSIDDTVELDESFRGERPSQLVELRRLNKLKEKQEYFKNLELIDIQGDGKVNLIGGEFISLYLRFFYEIRKYGNLSKAIILGKGPPTQFGEKIEKLISSFTYLIGEQPDLTRYTVHSYYREEGDIVQTVIKRFDILSKLINKDLPKIENPNEIALILTECFNTCRMLHKSGDYLILILAIRNMKNTRDVIHTELYFDISDEGPQIELEPILELLINQARSASISIENHGKIEAKVPDLNELLQRTTEKDFESLVSKLNTVESWKISSVQHIMDSNQVEPDEGDDYLGPEWISFYESNKTNEAIECIEKKIQNTQKRTKLAWLYNDLGYIETGGDYGKKERAGEHLERSIKLHYSNIPLTLLNLSILYIDRGKFPEAINLLEDTLLLTLGIKEIKAAFLRYRLPENHLNFKTKWEQNPANVIEACYLNLAYATLKHSGFDESLQILDEGIELLPSSVRLKHALARFYLFNKDALAANPIYNELAQLKKLPDNSISIEIKALGRRIIKQK